MLSMQYSSSSNGNALIPVRIDVSSNDKSARIIDTLLIDPTCWPIPLYFTSNANSLEEAVERNIQEYAHGIISDAEVQGMGRTVRHFTGRIELWTPSLQTMVEDQLRPQIWQIVHTHFQSHITTSTPTTSPPSLIPISIRLLLNNYYYNTSGSTTGTTPPHTGTLGIMVEEDFIFWDPALAANISPLEVAQDIAKDLMLPDEAALDIATLMLEQIRSFQNNNNPTNDAVVLDDETPSTSTSTSKPRGAWIMDPKEWLATTTHIVSNHRPL